jgi:hypothetical protein
VNSAASRSEANGVSSEISGVDDDMPDAVAGGSVTTSVSDAEVAVSPEVKAQQNNQREKAAIASSLMVGSGQHFRSSQNSAAEAVVKPIIRNLMSLR